MTERTMTVKRLQTNRKIEYESKKGMEVGGGQIGDNVSSPDYHQRNRQNSGFTIGIKQLEPESPQLRNKHVR